MKQWLKKINVDINSEQERKLMQLVSLFKSWNKKINLSSFNDDESIILKHIVDSLLSVKFEEWKNSKKIIDLGTGGGFPGLPLAIFFPQKKFTLIDSVNKKIEAVNEMVEDLKLKNVETHSERIEKIGQEKMFREKFDVVVERALAKYSTMLEYCLPCVKKNGFLIAYQTPEIEKEIKLKEKVLQLLGGKIVSKKIFDLPNNAGTREILVIKKIKSTPKKYPRKIGIPKKSSL
jgi:16S rRNA (guanine527-N7)-methyltransferase